MKYARQGLCHLVIAQVDLLLGMCIPALESSACHLHSSLCEGPKHMFHWKPKHCSILWPFALNRVQSGIAPLTVATVYLGDAQATLFGGADHIMFDWKPKQRTILHLVELMTGQVKQIDAPAYFTFHYINSFETPDGKALCIDFSHFDDPSFLNGLYLDNLRQHKQSVAKSPVV